MTLESSAVTPDEDNVALPPINTVTMDQPMQWLTLGVKDVLRDPVNSLLYGGLFVLLGYILGYLFDFNFIYILTMTAGFMLVGPFVATGLYDMAKRRENNESTNFFTALLVWRGNVGGILMFGLFVGLLLTFWVRITAVLFAVIIKNTGSISQLDVATSTNMLFFSGDGLVFLVIFMVLGGLVAALVYTLGVFSIPMMVDSKDNDLLSAAITSFKAVQQNQGPLFFWAVLLVILTGVGFVTAYLALAVTLPIAAYGTWHAYRDVVGRR